MGVVTPATARRFRTVVAAAVFTFVLYHAHRLLQLQYYRHCKADLFRVVLFHQSTMCTRVADILQVVEVAYHQVVKQVTSQILAYLSPDAAPGGLMGQFGGFF
jgi:hypothetical protein